MKQPEPVEGVLVRYSASEMPTPVIERLQRDTIKQFEAGDIGFREALRIINLLLTIALMKLTA